METLHIDRWRITHDPQATEAAYRQIPRGAAEAEPEQEALRNLARARERLFPAQALDLMKQLKIDPGFEGEAIYLGRIGAGRHAYRIGYFFVGGVDTGTDSFQSSGPSAINRGFIPFGGSISLGVTEKVRGVPEAFGGRKVSELLYEVEIPWLLESPEP